MNEDRYYIDLKLNSQSWFEAQTIRIKGSYLLSEVDAVIESYKIIDISLVAIEMKKLMILKTLSVIDQQKAINTIRLWLDSLNLEYENDSQFLIKAILLYKLVAGKHQFVDNIEFEYASYNYNEHEYWNFHQESPNLPTDSQFFRYTDNYMFFGYSEDYDNHIRGILSILGNITANQYYTRQHANKKLEYTDHRTYKLVSGQYLNESKNPVVHHEYYLVNSERIPVYENITYTLFDYYRIWNWALKRWVRVGRKPHPYTVTYRQLVRVDYKFNHHIPELLSTDKGYLTYEAYNSEDKSLDDFLPESSDIIKFNFPTKDRLERYCLENNLQMIPVVPERISRSNSHYLYYYTGQSPNRLEFETQFKINQYQLFRKVPLNNDVFAVVKAPKFAALKK